MPIITLDTETCGFHGPAVLIQWAKDDGPVHLHSVFNVPIRDTLELIERVCDDEILGFNLAFDWFKLTQTYTTLTLLANKIGLDEYPGDHIDAYAFCEPAARDGVCLKPKSALDLMLHARKGPYQSTMDRKDIRIKKVPTVLAPALANELEQRIVLSDIYFARKKVAGTNWKVEPTKNPDLCDIVLRFKASAALKALVQDALGIKATFYKDIDVDPKLRPIEKGWAPYALSVSNPAKNWAAREQGKQGRKGYAWPGVINYHITHWSHHTRAREYAANDVVYTRKLYEYFGKPPFGDDDSILACMVASVRWRGYKFDVEGVKKLREDAIAKSKLAPRAPAMVKKWINEVLTDLERAALSDKNNINSGTGKVILQALSEMKNTPCPDCTDRLLDFLGDAAPRRVCPTCKGNQTIGDKHPAAERAKLVLNAREAIKEVELYDKLLEAGRFHASFKVIGTLSGRMSGADRLNPQGIKNKKYVRKCFPLAFDPLELGGGDFSSFEVSIAAAVYKDQNLTNDLMTCANCKHVWTMEEYAKGGIECPGCGCTDKGSKCGKCKEPWDQYSVGVNTCKKCGSTSDGEIALQKFHGLFGQALKPGSTYADVVASKGTEDDLYDKGKRGGFGMVYGGDAGTLVRKIGVSEDVAREADEGFKRRYPGVGKARERIIDAFCSMRQPGGIGSRVEWHDPKEYIESLTGFKRFFTLENQICKTIFTLANKPPEPWKKLNIKVVRHQKDGREQKVGGALQSALYGAAFGIQSQMMRAAANHEIQSTGATITKKLQCRLWTLQPHGIHQWYIQPMNIHDELMAPARKELKPKMRVIVDTLLDEYRPMIPLIRIDWADSMNDWSEK